TNQQPGRTHSPTGGYRTQGVPLFQDSNRRKCVCGFRQPRANRSQERLCVCDLCVSLPLFLHSQRRLAGSSEWSLINYLTSTTQICLMTCSTKRRDPCGPLSCISRLR